MHSSLVPCCRCKPGALRNGEPFRDWDVQTGPHETRERLKAHTDVDRQFVEILSAVLGAGLNAVEAACRAVLSMRLFSADRQRQLAAEDALLRKPAAARRNRTGGRLETRSRPLLSPCRLRDVDLCVGGRQPFRQVGPFRKPIDATRRTA